MAVRNMAKDIAADRARQSFGFRNGSARHGPHMANGLRRFRDGIVVLDMALMRRTGNTGAIA